MLNSECRNLEQRYKEKNQSGADSSHKDFEDFGISQPGQAREVSQRWQEEDICPFWLGTSSRHHWRAVVSFVSIGPFVYCPLLIFTFRQVIMSLQIRYVDAQESCSSDASRWSCTVSYREQSLCSNSWTYTHADKQSAVLLLCNWHPDKVHTSSCINETKVIDGWA